MFSTRRTGTGMAARPGGARGPVVTLAGVT